MRHDIGTLRSVLSRQSLSAWHVGLKMVRGWPDAGEAEQMALPYMSSVVQRWADVVRWAPRELVLEMPHISRSSVIGAGLIQGITLPPRLVDASILEKLANNGWFDASLEQLDLSETRGGHRFIDLLDHPRVALSGLTHLVLRGCGVTDSHLSALGTIEALTHLDLGSNQLGDVAIKEFVDAARLPSLTHLDVRGNLFTEQGKADLLTSSRAEQGCTILV